MRRVEVEVENILRGEISSGSEKLSYYFWGWAGESNTFPGGRPWAEYAVGERYIFCLDWELDVLRSTVDYFGSSFPVLTGRHTGNNYSNRSPRIERMIASLLLTPGEEFNERYFSDNIHYSSYNAWYLAGKTFARTLMNQLLGHVSIAIREAACFERVFRHCSG
jgi:hypothetical protein